MNVELERSETVNARLCGIYRQRFVLEAGRTNPATLAEYAKSAELSASALRTESGHALLRTEGTGLLLRHHNF